MNADVTTNYFVRSDLVAARGVNSVLKKHIVPAAHSPPGAAESGERRSGRQAHPPGVSVSLSEAEAAKARIDAAGESFFCPVRSSLPPYFCPIRFGAVKITKNLRFLKVRGHSLVDIPRLSG